MNAAMHPDPHATAITLDDLREIEFVSGAGSRDNGLCIMTAAAWLAGQEHTDAPPCVSLVIRSLLIGFHDRCDHDVRQREDYKALAVVVIGTAPETVEIKCRRAFACADWAVRVVAPRALTTAGKPEQAAMLSGVAEIVDLVTAESARDKAREVSRRAYSAAAYADAAASAAAYAASSAAAAADAAATAAAAATDAASADAASSAAAYASSAAAATAAATAAAYADAASSAYAAGRRKMWDSLMGTLVPLVRRLAAMGGEE